MLFFSSEAVRTQGSLFYDLVKFWTLEIEGECHFLVIIPFFSPRIVWIELTNLDPEHIFFISVLLY